MSAYTVTQYVAHAPLAVFTDFDQANEWAKAFAAESTDNVHLVIDSWIGADRVTACHVYHPRTT